MPAGADQDRHLDEYIGNLRRAADRLADAGATVVIEPINTRVDVPGYLLDGTQTALECIRAADRPNIKLQYDVYHMQIMEGDLMRSVGRLLPWIGHIQIADNPGRHEPGTGEIAFERLLPHIDGGLRRLHWLRVPACRAHGRRAWMVSSLAGRRKVMIRVQR